jgi:acyl-CoA thioesterase
MLFSDVLDSGKNRDGLWLTDVPDDWMQGRSIFGGMQGALAVRAMRTLVPSEVPLRVLQVVFAGPVISGPVAIRPEVLRVGKSVTHVEARVLAGGQTLMLAVGVFGRGRASRVKVTPRPADAPPPEAGALHLSKGQMPGFAQHFSMRWLYGAPPYSGVTLPRAVIEVGISDATKTTEEHVVAIADAPPPVALSFLETPAVGSSMTWTLEMLRERVDDLPLDGWRLHVELVAAGDGYTDQSILVCEPGGDAVALSRQSMVVFG